jgi:4-hydroxy-2-oxoheptanedioate aldolase
MTSLKDQWAAGEASLGLWASVPNSYTAEILGRSGAGYVCVDMQHGLIGYDAAWPMIQGVLVGGGNPIARVPWNEPGIIGKMLDAGAGGIIVPMVNSVAEAEAAVAACRYPPRGARSFGPIAVAPRNDGYYASSNDNVSAIPMVETVQALAAVDDIVAVPGVDAIYVGPADLSISLGLPPGNNDDVPEFVEALETIVAACNNAGVIAGIHSSGTLTPRRLEMGFRMVTVVNDSGAMSVGIKAEMERALGGGEGAGNDKIY